MAPRKYHLGVGILVFVAFSSLFYYWYLGIPVYIPAKLFGITGPPIIPISRTLNSADIIYLAITLLLVLTGAEIADYDKAIMWMQHRDFLTHSCVIPTIFAVIVMVFTVVQIGDPIQSLLFDTGVNNVLLIAMVSFILGAASHLLLDYFPPVNLKELHKEEKALEAGHEAADLFISGMTGKELFRRLQGSALVHFWWEIKVPKEGGRSRGKAKRYEMRKTLPSRQSQIYYLANAGILILVALLLMVQYFILEFGTAAQQLLLLLLI
ncbi:MAG: hypothetical protein ACTSSA_06170 [Candidatus Freyarchaeota archaeon]